MFSLNNNQLLVGRQTVFFTGAIKEYTVTAHIEPLKNFTVACSHKGRLTDLEPESENQDEET